MTDKQPIDVTEHPGTPSGQSDTGYRPATNSNGSLALLVGFPEDQENVAAMVLEAAGFSDVMSDKKAPVAALLSHFSFDLVVVDVDYCDEYAPAQIAAIRRRSATKPLTRVVAVATMLPHGLRAQLISAGTDAIVVKRDHAAVAHWLSLVPTGQ